LVTSEFGIWQKLAFARLRFSDMPHVGLRNLDRLGQGSQTQIGWRATLQRKNAPQATIYKKAFAGSKIQEKPSK
jgi:hypothetical protein